MRARHAWAISLDAGWEEQPPEAALRKVRPGHPSQHVELTVQDWTQARAFAGWVAHRLSAASLTLIVRGWKPPEAGWVGRLGGLSGVQRHSVTVKSTSATIEVAVGEAVDLTELILACLPILTPHHALRASASPDVQLRPMSDLSGRWVFPMSSTRGTADNPGDDRVRPTDIVLTTADDVTAHLDSDGAMAAVTPVGLRTVRPDGRWAHHRAPVDPIVHRPLRRTVGDEPTTGRLASSGGRILLSLPDGKKSRDVTRGLRAADVAAVMGIDHLVAEPLPASDEGLWGEFSDVLVQASATGTIVSTAPGTTARGVPEALALAWAQAPGPDADLLTRTVASVDQRRAAHRYASTDAALERAVGQRRARPAAPAVSILLSTVRPELLTPMLDRIAAFDYPSLQVVIGLHRDDADAEPVRREAVERGLDAVVMAIPSSVSFGDALGRLSARADGDLLTKMDDDDYYGPDHVWDLVLAHRHSGAALVGKVAEYVHLEPLAITVRREGMAHETYSPAIAGGTMLIARGDLDTVGGWRPVPRSVDLGLIARVRREGGVVYRTHGLGYLYVRKGEGHTWDPGLGYFLKRNGEQWSGLLSHPVFGT